MLLPIIQNRMRNALAGMPTVLEALLASVPADSPLWDARPDPERFSLREVLAHLADYEAIWSEYVTQVHDAKGPTTLTGYGPDLVAAKGDYAHSDPRRSLETIRERRMELALVIDALTPEDLSRSAAHHRLGAMTLETLCVLFLAHDGYHIRQIAELVTDGVM